MKKVILFFILVLLVSCTKNNSTEPAKEYFNLTLVSKIQDACSIKVESGGTTLKDKVLLGTNIYSQIETDQYTYIEIENEYEYTYYSYFNTIGTNSLLWEVPVFNLWVTNNTSKFVDVYWMWDGSYGNWWVVGSSNPGETKDFGWWLQYDGKTIFYGDSSGIGGPYWFGFGFDTVFTFDLDYYEYVIN